jgi:hypothetical protein
MAIITYGNVPLTGRKYPNHSYTVERYTPSGKINIRIVEGEGFSSFLKMDLAETKDLIVRLQFAVHEAELQRK